MCPLQKPQLQQEINFERRTVDRRPATCIGEQMRSTRDNNLWKCCGANFSSVWKFQASLVLIFTDSATAIATFATFTCT